MTMTFYPEVPADLQEFVTEQLLPEYDSFDAAHRRDHAVTVIEEAMALARHYEVVPALVYTAAACHDLGLCEGRELHHLVSGRLIREMGELRRWFSEEEVETMAQAAEDHRASAGHEPRSIYGRIVAEADRLIDTETVMRRTVQYGRAHYPELTKAEHFERMVAHLQEKYAEGGYLKLWIPESRNAERLGELRRVIATPALLEMYFGRLYAEEEEGAPRDMEDGGCRTPGLTH